MVVSTTKKHIKAMTRNTTVSGGDVIVDNPKYGPASCADSVAKNANPLQTSSPVPRAGTQMLVRNGQVRK